MSIPSLKTIAFYEVVQNFDTRALNALGSDFPDLKDHLEIFKKFKENSNIVYQKELENKPDFHAHLLDDESENLRLELIKIGILKKIISKEKGSLNRLLFAASLNGNLKTVEYLKESVVDLNARYNFGTTALTFAARHGNLDVVKYLKESGADLNARNNFGHTALMRAAGSGNLDVVKYLKENGADLNARDDFGKTTLTLAAGSDHLDVVKYLKESGADLKARDDFGRTALTFAALSDHLDVVKYLKDNGAEE